VVLVPDKQDIIKYLRDNKDYLRNLKIKKIGLFGSYARDEQTELSDIDLFIEAPPDIEKICKIEDFISARFNKKVDIIRNHDNLKRKLVERILKEIIYVE
jgi:predicted nucleotidyltransferase